MKKFLVITIDVEPDCSKDWRYSDPLQFEGVSQGIAGRLQPLFNRHGIAPTYLINNVVLEDRSSVEIFRQLEGKYELGTHLHPEFIEPQKQYEHSAGRKGIANSCYYPPEIEFEKIRRITKLFDDAFGYAPLSFRAGRFSAGANTIRSLQALNYLVDTSVTPHINWNDASREKPVDFSNAPEQPYFPGKESIVEEGAGAGVMEVPVSIGLRRRNPVKEAIVSGLGIRKKYRRYKPTWIRPSFSSAEEMIAVAQKVCEDHGDRESVVFNMMFHNVEILPGLSPYAATEEDCRKYMHKLEAFIAFCKSDSVSSVTLSELYHECRK